MVRELVFDVRFTDSLGVVVTADTNIRVEFFEEGEAQPTAIRTLGTNPNVSIVSSQDADGYYYTTTLDVTNYARGAVTAKWYAYLSGSPTSPFPLTETQNNVFGDSQLTVADIKKYVRASLGFPSVSVELTGMQFSTIVEEALALYSQHCPAEAVKFLDYNPSVQVYHLPDLPYNGPFDVKIVRKVVTPITSDPIFGREFLRTNQPDLGTVIMGQAYLELAMRVLSSEPDWRWLHQTKELYVNIGPGVTPQVYGGFDVCIRYFNAVTLEMVREDHFRWFKRYCLALAKKILGQVRGKFSGSVPSPSGALALNHSDMIEQGVREEESLVEELRMMSPHVPPISG